MSGRGSFEKQTHRVIVISFILHSYFDLLGIYQVVVLYLGFYIFSYEIRGLRIV